MNNEQSQTSDNNSTCMLALFEALCRDMNKKQKRLLQREFERQGNERLASDSCYRFSTTFLFRQNCQREGTRIIQ